VQRSVHVMTVELRVSHVYKHGVCSIYGARRVFRCLVSGLEDLHAWLRAAGSLPSTTTFDLAFQGVLVGLVYFGLFASGNFGDCMERVQCSIFICQRRTLDEMEITCLRSIQVAKGHPR
jgi:hypothetical protein